MLSTGVDIIHIPRIERVLERHGERFLNRVFTKREIQSSRGRANELAVRFAAKEAVSKALGVGMRIMAHNGIGFKDVEILPDENGKPHVHLNGRALARSQELDLHVWAISLTHEREYGVASVTALSSS